MSATVVKEKRETTLPEEICEAAGIKPNDQIEWRFEDGEIRGRKLVPETSEEIALEHVDPLTLLPPQKIIPESLLDSIR